MGQVSQLRKLSLIISERKMMRFIVVGLLALHGTVAHHETGPNQCRDEEKKIEIPNETAAKDFARINAADGIENATELVFMSNINGKTEYYPCPGVMVSKTHVLISNHCYTQANAKVAVGYKADLVQKTEEFINRTVSEIITIENAHMVILKLAEELPEDHTRKIMHLPTKSCELGEVFKIKGWSFTPDRVREDDIFYDTFLMHEEDVSIVDKKDCPSASENECCMKMKQTEKEFKMMIGSPVFHEDHIIGFAHFDCNTQGVMSLVFPWVEEIKKIIS